MKVYLVLMLLSGNGDWQEFRAEMVDLPACHAFLYAAHAAKIRNERFIYHCRREPA